MKPGRHPREWISRPADHRRNVLAPPRVEQEPCQHDFRRECTARQEEDVKTWAVFFTEWKRVAGLKLAEPNFTVKKIRAHSLFRSGRIEAKEALSYSGDSPGFSRFPLFIVVASVRFMICSL